MGGRNRENNMRIQKINRKYVTKKARFFPYKILYNKIPFILVKKVKH